jgi:hypothetical protein
LVFPSSLYFRNTNNNLTAQFAVQAICLSLSLPLSPRPSSFTQYIVPGMSSFSSTGTAVGGLSWAEPKRDGHHDFTDTLSSFRFRQEALDASWTIIRVAGS